MTAGSGAFMGSGGVVTSYLLAHKALQAGTTGGIEHLANDKDFVSTKLSYKFDLTGPSLNVQTACSTSMVAVHLACQSILDGECEMALAGAASVRVPQISGYLYRQGDILSPDGACRAYDADARGTVFGSGAGVVVLKHLDDAVADGDHAPDGRSLADHLLRPVRFADGLRELARLGGTDFLEIGPGGALRGFVATTLDGGEDIQAYGLLDAKGDDWAVAMQTLGKLWEKGYDVDLKELYASRGGRRCSAPVTPFQRTRYWLSEEPGEAAEGEALRGVELELPGPGRHFQARYSAARHPWLPDHRIYGHVTLPVAGALIALADAAAQAAGGEVEIRDLTYRRACIFTGKEERLLHIEVPDGLAGERTLGNIAGSSARGAWQRHIDASARGAGDGVPPADLAELRRQCLEAVDASAFYAALDHLGLNYGPSFRNVRELSLGPGAALGRIALAPEAEEVDASPHPALIAERPADVAVLTGALSAAGETWELLPAGRPAAERAALARRFREQTGGAAARLRRLSCGQAGRRAEQRHRDASRPCDRIGDAAPRSERPSDERRGRRHPARDRGAVGAGMTGGRSGCARGAPTCGQGVK